MHPRSPGMKPTRGCFPPTHPSSQSRHGPGVGSCVLDDGQSLAPPFSRARGRIDQDTFGENLMPDEVDYVEIRERVRQLYERWGDVCLFEELQNLCYFIAVLAHG